MKAHPKSNRGFTNFTVPTMRRKLHGPIDRANTDQSLHWSEKLGPARGLLLGLTLGSVMWLGIGLCAWLCFS